MPFTIHLLDRSTADKAVNVCSVDGADQVATIGGVPVVRARVVVQILDEDGRVTRRLEADDPALLEQLLPGQAYEVTFIPSGPAP